MIFETAAALSTQDVRCIGLRVSTLCQRMKSYMEMEDHYHDLCGNIPSEQVFCPPPSLSPCAQILAPHAPLGVASALWAQNAGV